MLYDIEIKEEEHFLRATVSGMRTRGSISGAIHKIGEICRQSRYEKVMIDVRRLTGRIPIFDSLSLIFDDFNAIREAKIVRKAAIIETEIRRVRFTFFERVARSRNYDIRVFTDPETAAQWLRED